MATKPRKTASTATSETTLSDVLKSRTRQLDPQEIIRLFGKVSQERVDRLSEAVAAYISTNLPKAIERRDSLADYRTNPYVLMTAATVMQLSDPQAFATFLFNSKLYMGLETSFGKQVEAAFVSQYPIRSDNKWAEAPEKLAEFDSYSGLSREEKARRRLNSVWREIDKSAVVGRRRYLTSIKSGPNTINDTQVQGMTRAIIDNYLHWKTQTSVTYPEVEEIDVVLGLTYGTDRTTNNKENQILVKLLEHGFVEEDRESKPGVLIDAETRTVRIYRCIGKDFWAFIGQPDARGDAEYVFLEVLLALAKALHSGIADAEIEARVNVKLQQLILALASMMFPRKSLPEWVRDDFSDTQLFWFQTAITAFFDDGI